jgi:hypothetical protein
VYVDPAAAGAHVTSGFAYLVGHFGRQINLGLV